jgi:hypothetical protein
MSDTYSLVEATMKVIQDRRSIRDYTDEPVADQDLDMVRMPNHGGSSL